MIFQKPNPFPLTIQKNLEFPLREHGLTNKAELAALRIPARSAHRGDHQRHPRLIYWG